MGRRDQSRDPFRVVAVLDEYAPTLTTVPYLQSSTAIAGAVRIARKHPHSHIKVERFDRQQGRYVHHTQTQGAATR